MKRFSEWLGRKWQRQPQADLARAYRATFATPDGQRVLQHWLDHVYCTIYEGADPIQMATHNGRRSFVHEILEALDLAEHPENYEPKTETEER